REFEAHVSYTTDAGATERKSVIEVNEPLEVPYTSARNAFPGIVTAVKLGDVAAQVEIQAGPHRLVSLLTREAVEELGFEVGMQATARVKSTSVHIDRT
ncbi:TOBE domain-containing protein, partial [Streptomyces niveus]|uniref:TOBE domain-containing protein n=1 Tax=Streptomyces niveus TaxID=193462 RepID=UPI003426AC57